MTRIIGLGSPFGDDRVGWRVIELLQGRLPAEISLVSLDRPGAALINWMQGVDNLVLIDALRSGAAPGSIVALTPDDLETRSCRLTSHQLALSETVELAARLGHLPEQTRIYGIELDSFSNDELSEVAATAARELASRLAKAMA